MQMTTPDQPPAPLAGITVLDFTRVGPYLTMTLARRLRAEVIKIEVRYRRRFASVAAAEHRG